MRRAALPARLPAPAAGPVHDIEICQVTENGVILSMTVAGTKYRKYGDLN